MLKRTIIAATLISVMAGGVSAQEDVSPETSQDQAPAAAPVSSPDSAESPQDPAQNTPGDDARTPVEPEALAQPAPVATIGPWKIECDDTGCVAAQTVNLPDTDNLSVTLVLTGRGDGSDPAGPDGVLTAIIPLGIVVNEPAAIVPAEKSMTIPYWAGHYTECLPAGCIATGTADFGLLASVVEPLMRIRSVSGYVGVPIDLSQIAEASAESLRAHQENAASGENKATADQD